MLIPLPLLLLIAIFVLLIGFLLHFWIRNGFGRSEATAQNRWQVLQSSLNESFKNISRESADQARLNRQELLQLIQESRREMLEMLQLQNQENSQRLQSMNATLENRLDMLGEKLSAQGQATRDNMSKTLREFGMDLRNLFDELKQQQRDRLQLMEQQQQRLTGQTEQQLEKIRETVEEKLQKTLQERLSHSFETVGRQLIAVQEGLGEMRTLAQDVGGLKRVLSNVKMRGGIGEVQLAMLLEQLLAPDQYEANVRTRKGSQDLVEFAIKLPGREERSSNVWLPVDAKFPRDVYEQLQEAHDSGDPARVDAAQRNLEQTLRKMGKDISDKYLDPPHTTDFAILFLPFEGIYAEVIRKASLLEDLQRNYKIVVTGPTTLAAILNSLQMGFRSLAIQKRSSEVWQVLAAVKKEFELFGGMLQKAQGNIQTGLNQLDEVMGKRTRAIQRRLRGVESLEAGAEENKLPDIRMPETEDEE